METIGLIGFGVMGSKAAEKILQAGHSLLVFDESSGALEKTGTIGAEIVSSPMEMSKRVAKVLMFLPGPKEVDQCVSGSDGLLNGATGGSVIVDLSTVDPGVTLRLSEAARLKGVGYLDAPVLGRPASVGKWALPVGGELEYLGKCRPVLDLLAEKIFHIGPSGSGNRVKLLNQMMFGAINAMTAEMMAIADRMGIPPGLLYETISASQAATVSNLFKELGRRISLEDYADPTFTVDLLEKDVRLAIQMAEESNAPPILAGTVARINEKMQGKGFGRSDTSIMWKGYEKIWEETGGR
jgi:3-hydroxyisobutyrate dehydrogenase